MTALEKHLEGFLAAKQLDMRRNSAKQLRFKLEEFVHFLTKAGCKAAQNITREHLTGYRETWTKFADSTQRQRMLALKQFLRDLAAMTWFASYARQKRPSKAGRGVNRDLSRKRK